MGNVCRNSDTTVPAPVIGNSASSKESNNSKNKKSKSKHPKISTSVSITKDEDGKKVNEYILLKKIGRGSYGDVSMCFHSETNKPFAIKTMDKTMLRKQSKPNGKNALDDVQKEIEIIVDLSHDNVVYCEQVIEDEDSKYIFIVMEYCEGGKMQSRRAIKSKSNKTDKEEELEVEEIDDSSEEEDESSNTSTHPVQKVFRYFLQMLDGLEYLHEQGIYHADLKPENILVGGDDVAKIADFGVSTKFSGDLTTIRIKGSDGTPAFQPPEIFGDEDFDPFKVDIWALGVTLFVLVFEFMPFEGDNYLELGRAIREDKLAIPSLDEGGRGGQLSKDAEESFGKFMSKMLQKNISERFQNVKEIKNHEFIEVMRKVAAEEPKIPVNLSVL